MPAARSKTVEAPTVIRTPADRGLTLRAWLKRKGLSISDFAESVGIARATLNRYLVGTRDLASIDQEIADRLLRTMGIADGEAWELLAIPEEHRHTFRSFRPPPLGHGAVLRTLTDIRLDEPLFGSVALPAGTLIRVAKDGPGMDHNIVRLKDGRLYAASNGVQAEGESLGFLVSAHFAIAQ